MSTFKVATALLLSLNSIHANSFNWDQGMTALWHSQNAYCDPESYLERTPKGPLEGLKVTYQIYDEEHETNGYVGYSLNEATIYVAIRGSVEYKNFVTDAHIKFENVDYPSSCSGMEDSFGDMKIHQGFYECSKIIGVDVASEVSKLSMKYPSFQVVVTGHSLGGAVATLIALGLKHPMWEMTEKVQLYTFGCPRLGNEGFAVCASNEFGSNSSRVTHYQDIIPHSPSSLRYMHMRNEWYQPTEAVDVKECSGYEDPTCMFQWGGKDLSIEDHLLYLGIKLGSTAEASCAQIMDMP